MSARRTVVPAELAGSVERGRVVRVCPGGQASDLAGVALEAFQHGQYGQGDAAAMPWATRLWAWATLPPIDASVPQPTSNQP